MFGNVCNKLAVVNGVDAFSQPFAMQGANAFRFSVVIANLGGATGLTCTPQGTNDGQNYDNLSASSSLGLGYSSFTQSTITHAMVRLKLHVDGTGTVITSVDVYTSQQ